MRFFYLLCLSFFALALPAQFPQFSDAVEINQLPNEASDRYRFQHPYELMLDAEGFLWVSTKAGRISRIDAASGLRQLVLDLGPRVLFTRYRNGNGELTRVAQDGLQGMALHANYGEGTGQDWLYAAYVYDADPGGNTRRALRLVRYDIQNDNGVVSATGEVTLLDNLPASNDHNGGRLKFGPDAKLYYAIGDQGANQGGNRCNPILAQETPTVAEVNAADWRKYQGKVLRIDLDGGVPDDNPTINGVRSHVFSYGHRNPQGLAFGRNPDGTMPVDALLYANEHGHRTDDEVNLVLPGKNYGWPYVAGFRDNLGYQYYNWSSSNNCPNSSTSACDPPADAQTTTEMEFDHLEFQPPLGAYFVNANPPCDNFLSWPTLAPSSIAHYNYPDGVAEWANSLLVTSLKRGTVFRLQLDDSGQTITSDTIGYFTSRNRYRDLAISPDGRKLYLLTDSIGGTSFATGNNERQLLNRGSILAFTFQGLTTTRANTPGDPAWTIFPNPTSGIVRLETEPALVGGRYTVYDIQGRHYDSGQIAGEMTRLDLSLFRPGLYLIKVKSPAGLQSVKKLFVAPR